MRIRWMIVAVVGTVALAGCDWPTFMANAGHTGFSQDTSISVSDVSGGLGEQWQASLGSTDPANIPSSPVVAKGLVYVGTQGGIVAAYHTDGGTNCDTAASPKVCQPAWQAASVNALLSTPSVAGGFLYVVASNGTLYTYDAAGITNCTVGRFVVCHPLWTAAVPSSGISSPVVSFGRVYAGSSDGSVYAFDAAGVTGCSGGVCAPLRKFSTGSAIDSSPAITNNVLYVGNNGGKLSAFDATGATNCDASHVCQPQWTGATGGSLSSPSVAGGRVFIGSGDHKLYAFDAAGTTGCAGSPKTCAPLWTATTANSVLSSPAVANGVVYIGTLAGGPVGARLEAYDANGVTNCSGAPVTCTPRWTSGSLGIAATAAISVANGVVYIDAAIGIFTFSGSVFAFDVTAPAAHCTGAPKVCTPLATLSPASTDPLGAAPSISDGFVYVAGAGLHAFAK